MPTFYDEWLRYWDDSQERRANARKIIHEEELEWVRTKQDYRAALLMSPQNGFATTGNVMLAEIPRKWNTGKHSHGEEAIYIVEGEGFSVIDGKRYDWDAGSCLFIPFGVVHQHFNTGDLTVRYVSAMAVTLEHFAGLARIVQHEEARETPMSKPDGFELADSDVHPEYGRIVLRMKDALVTDNAAMVRRAAEKTDEYAAAKAKEMRTPGAPGHRAKAIYLMDSDKGFKPKEINMTAVFVDEPGKNSGKHSHMEAILYVLEGEGYSIIDGERIEWKKGSLFQVQGPQTVHQHFNTGQTESRQLRIHFGLRSQFFQTIARKVFPYEYYEYSSYGDSH